MENLEVLISMDKKVFKAYDIRGIYGKEIDEKDMDNFIKAVIYVLKPKRISLAHDIRKNNIKLYDRVIKINRFVDMYLLGRVPTTIFYVFNRIKNIDVGIIFTASHNPKEYVGIKIVRNGKSISYKDLTEIKEIFYKGVNIEEREVKVEKIDEEEVFNAYLEYIKKEVGLEMKVKSLVFDVSNGSFVGKWIKHLVKSLNIDDVMILNNIDDGGMFSSHLPDTSKIENYEELINKCEKNACWGVGFDGDGDRVLIASPFGFVLPSEFIAYLISKYFNKSKILVEVSVSKYMIKMMENLGKKIKMIRTGHIYMEHEMEKSNLDIGVERSGHFYFKTRIGFVEDSLLSLYYFVSLLSQYEKEIIDEIKKLRYYFYQDKFNVVIDLKQIKPIIEKRYSNHKIIEIDGIRVEHPQCKYWFLLRKSNTENVLRIIIESQDENTIKEIKDELLKEIKKLNENTK